MKKRAAIVAAVMTVLSMFGVPAASASCTEIIDDAGCIETVVCRAGERVLGDKVQCIE